MNRINAPWNPETLKVRTTKHFDRKYSQQWQWSKEDLRDAIIYAYGVKKVGRKKYEIYTFKKGFKKIIGAYYDEAEEILCISGSQGGSYEKMSTL